VLFQAAYNCDGSAELESSEATEQHAMVDGVEQSLNTTTHRNLFSDLQTSCISETTLPNAKHLLVPKAEQNSLTVCSANVDSNREQTDCDHSATDVVKSIVVRLPLIVRLRRSKCETPVSLVKTENVDESGGLVAAAQPTTVDAQTTAEGESDTKKETTAAAKSLQLAREAIANIFGSEVQLPTTMKIPKKRRAEKQEQDDYGDAKHSRTSSQNRDSHDRSSSGQHSRYVVCSRQTGFDDNLSCDICSA